MDASPQEYIQELIRMNERLVNALEKIADPRVQLPWQACARIAREAFSHNHETQKM